MIEIICFCLLMIVLLIPLVFSIYCFWVYGIKDNDIEGILVGIAIFCLFTITILGSIQEILIKRILN